MIVFFFDIAVRAVDIQITRFLSKTQSMVCLPVRRVIHVLSSWIVNRTGDQIKLYPIYSKYRLYSLHVKKYLMLQLEEMRTVL